jgi:predicted DNA binding protein
MSIFGEFHIPADTFTFYEAFQAHPEMVIEIDRVVAADKYLTPYFWVAGVPPEDFEAVAREDPTVQKLRQLDASEDDDAVLYRADWTDRIEALIYAYTHIGAAIIAAQGKGSDWMLRMRFDDHDKLDQFHEYLNEEDVSFDLQRLYEITHPRSGSEFGLTPKQTEALLTASKMGFFELPREATMEEVAEKLGIAPQTLSDRIRRAQNTLIENTLRVEGPPDSSFPDR